MIHVQYKMLSITIYLIAMTTFQTLVMPSPTNRAQQSENELSSRKDRFLLGTQQA